MTVPPQGGASRYRVDVEYFDGKSHSFRYAETVVINQIGIMEIHNTRDKKGTTFIPVMVPGLLRSWHVSEEPFAVGFK